MALCHDERDFALGFTRRDPHGSRTPARSKRNSEREWYITSLSKPQRRAYNRVQLFLAAIGQYLAAKGEVTPIHLGALHRLFPDFARAMGWRGAAYTQENGRCQAIDISYPENTGSIWLITPYDHYTNLDEQARKSVHTKRVRQAALETCRAWLPNWKWENPRLPA